MLKNLLAGKLTDSEIKEFLNNFWKKVGVYIENGIQSCEGSKRKEGRINTKHSYKIKLKQRQVATK